MVESCHGATELEGCGGLVGTEKRTEYAVVDLGVEHGNPKTVGRGDIGVGVRQPLDEAVETQAAQVVGHLVGGVVRTEQAGNRVENPPAARTSVRLRRPR